MTEIFFPEKPYDSFAILEEGLKPQNLKVYDVRMKLSKKRAAISGFKLPE